jgi:hypothetical protein
VADGGCLVWGGPLTVGLREEEAEDMSTATKTKRPMYSVDALSEQDFIVRGTRDPMEALALVVGDSDGRLVPHHARLSPARLVPKGPLPRELRGRVGGLGLAAQLRRWSGAGRVPRRLLPRRLVQVFVTVK